MRLQSLTLDELIARNVDPRFARVLTDPEAYHPELSILVAKIGWDYFVPDDTTDVVPLWGCNEDAYVRWTRGGRTEYVDLLHDDPEWITAAASEQGIKCRLWNSWVDLRQSDDEEALAFAEAIGFRHANQAMHLWENDYDAFKEWMLTFEDDSR